MTCPCPSLAINSLRPRQNGRHFPDDTLKCTFFNENVWISIKISLKFVPKGPINNIPALVQIMAWRRPGDKPLSEPVMVLLPTHICVTRPQWVKLNCHWRYGIDKLLHPTKKLWNVITYPCASKRGPKTKVTEFCFFCAQFSWMFPRHTVKLLYTDITM